METKTTYDVEVYGSSDDLIELEGDIREEWSNDDGYIVFSDGTLLSVLYEASGFWRIHVLTLGDGTRKSKVEGTDIDDNYSDIVQLTRNTPFKWAMFGKELARA